MKSIHTILLLLLLAGCPGLLHAQKQQSYLHSIAVSGGKIVKQGRTVELSMMVDLTKSKIHTQHTVALTPVLVAADGSREALFPAVVIDGKTRNKIYLRAQRLESVKIPPCHNDSAQVIIRRLNGREQDYAYTATLPYERWMPDGRVELREQIHGCTNCNISAGHSAADHTLPNLCRMQAAYIPVYRLDTLAPEPEKVKVRAETRTARLQFRQGSYKIMPEFKNNRAELDTISNSVERVAQNTDFTITGIYITGYASPEGGIAYNTELSEQRARAVAEYISRHDHIAPELLHVDWKGEDWEGLVSELDKYPGLNKRDEVYAIIERYKDDRDLCEKRLRGLTPPEIYRRLVNEVYPALRRNEYRVEYNVRNFDLEEARRMIDERPDLLSLSEMYKVAGSYGKGTAEYSRVMAVAMRHYPTSPAALNENARIAIERKDYAAAVALLEKAEATAGTAELLNTLGVAYVHKEEYGKAEEKFHRAAEMGSEAARHNLGEVRKAMEHM